MYTDNRDLEFIKKITEKYLLVQDGGLDNRVYRITIQNTPDTPWLDWIEQGKKTYEGRLNRGIFLNMKVEDVIIFNDKTGKTVKTIIESLKYYPDFGEAYNDLGSKLVPIEGITPDKVKDLYWKYFRQDDIEKHGVVAIEIKVIK